ncbi:MAG: DUF370 domain-containing protein [Ruminococcaceae bacterium]|nr:DUF370 domain-containing protein [Oscillospiraceae bacterium]
MYVHAGNNRIIRKRDIIGIFDMDTATMESATRDYLRAAEKEGRMVNIKEEIPKSFIVACHRKNEDTVYVSQISTGALYGRIKAGISE